MRKFSKKFTAVIMMALMLMTVFASVTTTTTVSAASKVTAPKIISVKVTKNYFTTKCDLASKGWTMFEISTSKSFKSSTTKYFYTKRSGEKAVVFKLSTKKFGFDSSKKYYVRARATTAYGETVLSKWSNIKSTE